MADREKLTWELFGTATCQLASNVVADRFAPDLILAIARGGLFVAGALGYALEVKNVHTMNVQYYIGVDQRLDVPLIAEHVAEVRCASYIRSRNRQSTARTCGAAPIAGSTSPGPPRPRLVS